MQFAMPIFVGKIARAHTTGDYNAVYYFTIFFSICQVFRTNFPEKIFFFHLLGAKKDGREDIFGFSYGRNFHSMDSLSPALANFTKKKIAEKRKKAGFFLKKPLQFGKKYSTISGYMDENRAHPLRRRFQAYHSIPQKAENTEGGKD